MNKIVKKIIYQKIYSRYKELFDIDIDDIKKNGVSKFVFILKDIALNEAKYKVKYFRLENVYFEDYFSANKGKILISINNLNDIDSKIETLKFLDILNINYKLIFKIELSDIYITSKLFLYLINKTNLAIYIKSKYNRLTYEYIKKISHIFNNKEIYLGLDYIKNQDEVNNIIIFNIINFIKENGGIINNDLIRLESAYRGIYVLGPKELHLDLNEYCNTSCNFCFTNGPGYKTKRGNRENNYKINNKGEQFVNLFRKIQISGTESLALGITGEPFLHPEIDYILKELKSINIKIGILTNGYKILENMDNIIENKNITHFYINISSGNIESFKNTRPNDNFSNFINTWKSIKILREKRPDIIIRCLYVITPLNINGIDDFINLCINNNISEIELKRVVPYDFSNKEFYFSEYDINNIKSIIIKYISKIQINNNFDYIINEFNEILEGKTVQFPEDEEIDTTKLEGKTLNCYNPYFYISLFRNSAYTCGKFEARIGKLTNLDLFELLFEKKNINNIFKASKNVKKFLGVKKWREKCNRCHHLDAINIVKDYIKYKNISLNIIQND